MTQQVHIHDAATYPRSMWRHLPTVVDYPGMLWRSRWLIHNFFRRDLLSRFRGAFLGPFWVLVQPIFQFCIYFLVFGIFFGRAHLGSDEGPTTEFAIYLFAGIIMMSNHLEATNKGCGVVTNNGNLVKKIVFPSQALPVPTCMVALVLYLFGAAVCLIIGTLLDDLRPGWLLLALPLVMVTWFVLMVGVGMVLGTLQVFARDTKNLFGLASMAWFFTSPVFWKPQMILGQFPTLGLVWFKINPMYSLLMAQRYCLGWYKETGDPWGFWSHLGTAAAWAVFWFLLGYALFTSRRHKFADLV